MLPELENQMGRLLIDIDNLNDELPDQDAKVVKTSLEWDEFQDELTGLQQTIMAVEADILRLWNSLDGV